MERVALAVLLVVAGPAYAVAQRLTITPTVGAFIPLAPQSSETSRSCWGRPPDEQCYQDTYQVQLAPSVAYGARLALTFDRVVGVEVTAAIAETHLRRTFSSEPEAGAESGYVDVEGTAARSTVLAMRLTLQRSLGWANIVGAFGVARVELSGSGYDTWGGDLDRLMHGPTVGARFEIPVTRFAKAELGVTGHFYRMTVDQGRMPDVKMTQNDWLLQSGFTIGL